VLFNSPAFVVFFAVAACGWHLCPLSWRRYYLVIASYVFYFTWSIACAVLLAGLTAVAFWVGRKLGAVADDAGRRRLLTAGVLLLLLPLATLKYFDAILAALIGSSAGAIRLGGISLVGAVGISYYTLKLISYLVDVYWERIQPCRSPVMLAAYAAFFPQIISGPIQRAGSFLSQIEQVKPTPPEMIASGLRLMLFGFFKKLVVADRLGVLVNQVFGNPYAAPGGLLALGSYAFAVELYMDFSGLTDIARGAGRVLGFASPENFDAPFYAENIAEFWRRWHMTLTTWLTDYVFTPLRMVLREWGQTGLILSLGINMLAIGIWHGPRWTYVMFGMMHAAYLIGCSVTARRRKRALQKYPLLSYAHRLTGPVITFHMVVASFVVFRAESLSDAWYVLSRSAGGIVAAVWHLGAAVQPGLLSGVHAGLNPGDLLIAFAGIVLIETIHVLRRMRSSVLFAMPAWVRWAGYYTLVLCILILGQAGSEPFIYAGF
jgi:alginate O-acetyltransferase complex protein AlgI